MTSYSTIQSAVDAMRQGAVDYISKPFNHDEIVLMVSRALEKTNIERQNTILKQEVARDYPIDGMIGSCEPMKKIVDLINRVAPTDATALILGETGTGKELVARAIHAQSSRKNNPLISVNCAAFADNLIESELFGHEKGAFTGALRLKKGLIEAANDGTLFLDEIGDLPFEAQANLLRVLQENEIRRVGSTKTIKVNVRILIATHKDLKQMVSDKLFREDLYYRLNVFELNLPPLRERAGDTQQLANAILTKMCRRIHRKAIQFSDEAYQQLSHYHWPGNVRELENVIERAVILCTDKVIHISDLGFKESLATDSTNTVKLDRLEHPLSLDDYFITVVKKFQPQFNETELSKILGISRKNLWERRLRLNIPARE
jgi:DNA-binding NtrC family response regulator